MHKEAAGIATETPIMNLAAVRKSRKIVCSLCYKNQLLTYITPSGCPVNDVAIPDNGVDEVIETS
jgi:hypothetical protein